MESSTPNIASDKRRKAIGILGMHRSGTSAIAGAISQLGVYFGHQDGMMASLPENPEGFWERNDLVRLHDNILNKLKRTWDTVMPLPSRWHAVATMRSDWFDLKRFIENTYSNEVLWGWKDPRTALLLDLWKDLLKELGIEIKCVYIVRNPLDVAKSLAKRDGFAFEKSFGIWLNYNISALRASADISKLFISYENLIKHSVAQIKRCSHFLNIHWPEDDAELKKRIETLIHPGLSHNTSNKDALFKRDVPRPVIKLYQLIESVTDRHEVPHAFLQETLDEISGDFLSFSSSFRQDMDNLWDLGQRTLALKHQLDEHEKQLKDKETKESHFQTLNEKINQLEKHLTERSEYIAQGFNEIQSKNGKLMELEKSLHERDDQLKMLNNAVFDLKEEIKQKEILLVEQKAALEKTITGSAAYKLGNAFRIPRKMAHAAMESFKSRKKNKSVLNMMNYLMLVYDSCRYDVLKAAKTPVLDSYCSIYPAQAPANFTYASHQAFFVGILPNATQFLPYYNRFKKQLVGLTTSGEGQVARQALYKYESDWNLIDGLRKKGYQAIGAGAMNWFRQGSLVSSFDHFLFSGTDADKQIEYVSDHIDITSPFFGFINFGETHAPYTFHGNKTQCPEDVRARRISWPPAQNGPIGENNVAFQWQVRAAEFLDSRLSILFGSMPGNTIVILTSDHGDCFGEDGYWGHGLNHPKILEVPLSIFRLDRKPLND